MKKLLLAALAFVVLSVQGCASGPDRPRYKWQVGMTKEQVLGSVDGSPKRVNKTTTASGTREQWIYAGPSYLYFDENGILRTIQSPF